LHDVGAWQFPPWHVAPGGHGKPHWLQLFGSVLVSVQPDSQQVSMPTHVGPPLHDICVHAPPWQALPLGQKLSQPPQLFGSVFVSVQPAGQHVSSGAHGSPPWQSGCVTQLPFTHPALSAQPLPHRPQLPGSVWVSLQPLSQQLSPPVQTGPPLHVLPPTHAPAMQASSAPHTLVQLPQCSGETCSLTHVPAQQLSSATQPICAHPWGGWHAPARQASPFGQVRPQKPQSFGFVPSSTHVDPQHASPSPHAAPPPHVGTHSLFWQASPGGHWLESTQPTQMPWGSSQIGFDAGHWVSLVQPPGGSGTHWCVAGLHASPVGHVSGSVKHATHTPGGSSQYGSAAVGQPSLDVQPFPGPVSAPPSVA